MGKKKGGGKRKQTGSSNRYMTLDSSSDDGRDLEPRSRRKNRGRNKHINSNALYDEQLRDSIEADGSKSVIEMAADGNCLFRSISDQLFHDYGQDHERVRADISDFLEAHEEEFSVFLVLDETEEDEDAANFQDYIEKMRQPGEWGGNVELVVAARLYRRNITVFSASLAAFTIEHGHPTKDPAGPDLMLSYHDNDHYNSVRDNKAGKPPPPIKTYTKQDTQNSTSSTSTAVVSDVPDDNCQSIETEPMETDPIEEKEKRHNESKKVSPKKKASNNKPRKNDVCPCGSGLRYKKCCLAKEKHQARLKARAGNEPVDEKPEEMPEMSGNFRVLKI